MENVDVHNVAELMSEGDENRQIEKKMTQLIHGQHAQLYFLSNSPRTSTQDSSPHHIKD